MLPMILGNWSKGIFTYESWQPATDCVSCLPFYYTRFTCTTCFFFGLVLDTYEAMSLPKSCWLAWSCIFFFIILFLFFIFQVSRCNLEAKPTESFSLTTHEQSCSTNSRKGNSWPLYHTQGVNGVLQHSWSGVFKISRCTIHLKKKKIKTVLLPAFLASAGSFLLFSNLSLLKALCHGCNPTVVESTPYSDDRIQGWIQDCNALCQAWECKGLSLLMTNLKFLS